MFICEVDRPWAETPFLFQGFPLLSHGDIAAVREVCQFVYIDESRRIQVTGKRTTGKLAPGGLNKVKRLPLSEEVGKAQQIYRKGSGLISGVFEDIQLGRGINTVACREFVRDCVNSMLRNESAMVWLTRIKSRDEYTSQHCLSVAVLAIGFGRHLGCNQDELEQLGLAGLLHDVGKIKVDQQILNKPGRLDADEFAVMKEHARLGYELLLGQRDLPASAVDVAHSHHERLDGSGYPRGLRDEQIPRRARIVSICDCYDAITSHRVYDSARPPKEAFKALMDGRNSQFDAKLVIRFIEWLGVFPLGSLVALHTGEVGVVLETHAKFRLRPRVVVIRDEAKQQCPPRYLDLAQVCTDPLGNPYRISDSLPDGSFGVHLADPAVQALLNADALKALEQVIANPSGQ